MIRSVLVLLLLLGSVPARAEDARVRVAILPFSTPAEAPQLRQYGEGTMDSLITGLKNVPRFIMIDRGRIERVIKEQACPPMRPTSRAESPTCRLRRPLRSGTACRSRRSR